MNTRQVTFAFGHGGKKWYQFIALARSMKGIHGSFYRRTE